MMFCVFFNWKMSSVSSKVLLFIITYLCIYKNCFKFWLIPQLGVKVINKNLQNLHKTEKAQTRLHVSAGLSETWLLTALHLQ